MQPKFKKTARRSDLEYPYEYRGFLIKSGSRMMYGRANWFALDAEKKVKCVANSLKKLCVSLDDICDGRK